MVVQVRLVRRREIIDHLQTPAVDVLIGGAGGGVDRDLDDGVAVVTLSRKSVGIQVVSKVPLPMLK